MNSDNWPVIEASATDEEGITRGDCGANGVGPGACGLFASIGEVDLMASLSAAKTMQARGTFGAGVLLRGIYPKRKDYYAFHVLYRSREVAKKLEPLFTEQQAGLRHFGEMEPLVTPEAYRAYDLPEMRRYFMIPPTADEMLRRVHTTSAAAYVRKVVEKFNARYMGDARIFSSGKDLGVFLTAMELSDTMEVFDLEQYAHKPVTAIMVHMRWPTSIVNSGVWWGAHPISFLNNAIVHNGDLSSSSSNRQGLEAMNIKRSVGTDSEAILLEIEDLMAHRGFTYQEAEWVICRKYPKERKTLSVEENEVYLSVTSDPILARYKMSGPSSFVSLIGNKIIVGRDRDGLRQLWMGVSDDGKSVIWSSEEKVIYQSAWLSKRIYDAINCEPGRLVAFEIGEDGSLTQAFGQTITGATANH